MMLERNMWTRLALDRIATGFQIKDATQNKTS